MAFENSVVIIEIDIEKDNRDSVVIIEIDIEKDNRDRDEKVE